MVLSIFISTRSLKYTNFQQVLLLRYNQCIINISFAYKNNILINDVEMEYSIKTYQTEQGKRPFRQWINKLNNIKTRVAIELRLDRLEVGNFGQCKSLRSGLYELKIDTGPGYRIYFSKTSKKIVLLLCAGNKKSQIRDISKARKYLNDYKKRGTNDEQKNN